MADDRNRKEIRQLAAELLDDRRDKSPITPGRGETSTQLRPDPAPSFLLRLLYWSSLWCLAPKYRRWIEWDLDANPAFIWNRVVTQGALIAGLEIGAVVAARGAARESLILYGVPFLVIFIVGRASTTRGRLAKAVGRQQRFAVRSDVATAHRSQALRVWVNGASLLGAVGIFGLAIYASRLM